MERPRPSVTGTPLSVVGRRSRSKSYRKSIRSCFGAASRVGLTPPMTSRKLNTSRKPPHLQQDTYGRVSPEHLALLVKSEWQLSYVTPLHRFRHTQLKSYSRQLSAFIAAEKLQGWAVEVEGPQGGFRASLSLVPGMAETDTDPETVLIQIHSGSQQRPFWSGWLTCVNGNPEYLRTLPAGFTCLPLFGCRGAERLSALVRSWFQRTFDCCFAPLQIAPISLQWLAALWTDCHAESGVQQLGVVWSVPAKPPLQVSVTVNASDAWELWSSVRKGCPGDEACIDIEEVTRFMQGIKGHFYRHFRLDLSAALLSQVSTALGWAKLSGRVKMANSRYMSATLSLLTECALLKMPI